MRRRQRQPQVHRHAPQWANARWLRRWAARRVHPTSPRSAQGLTIVAALAGVLMLMAGSGAEWAPRIAHRQTPPVVAHSSPAGMEAAVSRSRIAVPLPAEGHWRDTASATTYSASFQPNSDGFSAFGFTTPLGEQIQGNLALVQLADGTYAQGLGIATGNKTLPTVVTRCLSGTLESDTPIPIEYTFISHMSQDGLAAFAMFSYAKAQDKLGIVALCQNGTQSVGITTYRLLAGCTLDSCQDLASLAGPSVDQYDAAVLGAEAKGSQANWDAVYQRTCQQITAQYPAAEFATYLNQQVESVGKITKLSEPISPPQPEYTPEGQAYFEITQTVTVLRNGASSTRTLTSYYLLENGAWKFWFSD
jgi:hypothetical protein